MIEWSYVLAGAVTGYIVGLTGVGGGAIMTPMLLFFFGVKPTTAVATDLWYAAITKLSVVFVYNQHKQIDWEITRKLWFGSIPAAIFIFYALSTGILEKCESFLPQIIGGVILITALGLFVSGWIKQQAHKFSVTVPTNLKTLQSPLTVFAGVGLGSVVTLTSVGAGALGTIILLYMYPYRLTPYKLISTEVAHAIPLAMLAGLGYLWVGEVNFSLLFNLLLGSIPAAIFGGLSAHKFKDHWLRVAIGIVLTAAGFKLLKIL